jgi:N-acetylmuramoyl-L-alanine amidase
MGKKTTPGQRRTRATRRLRRAIVAVAVLLVAVVALALHRRIDASGAASSALSGGTAVDPSTFAPGACVTFPPTSGDRDITVFLDAGHGGIDPGGVGVTESGSSIDEAEGTLPVEVDVVALLRAKGFNVVVSRTGNSTVAKLTPSDVTQGTFTLQGAHDDVAARDVCADESHAQALVGIYYDAGGSAENAGSIAAYDADRPFASSNLRLATLVQTDVLARMNAQGWGIPDDGVQTDDQLGSLDGDPESGGLAGQAAAYDHLLLLGPASPGYFDTPSTMPGTVIEPLYITDPFEGSIAASSKGQSVIAQGIATAVEQYFGTRPA